MKSNWMCKPSRTLNDLVSAASPLQCRRNPAAAPGTESSETYIGREMSFDEKCDQTEEPSMLCLQCFDAVGWAALRASGL